MFQILRFCILERKWIKILYYLYFIILMIEWIMSDLEKKFCKIPLFIASSANWFAISVPWMLEWLGIDKSDIILFCGSSLDNKIWIKTIIWFDFGAEYWLIIVCKTLEESVIIKYFSFWFWALTYVSSLWL